MAIVGRDFFNALGGVARVAPQHLQGCGYLAYKAFHSIAPTQIADYEGRKPYMKSCIEFSQSQELDALIRSYDYQVEINP